MDHFLSDSKRLVQRLQHHDNAVDILIGEATNLQNKLIAMRQYKDEVSKMNQAANHRPRSTLILGSQLENQRIQTLEQENRELNISLAEHQSALELIMNKYREQVLVMMKTNGTSGAIQSVGSQPSETELKMSEQIAEMAFVMRQSASIDESVAEKEIEIIRSLQIENDNLRQLLQISGQNLDVLNKKPESNLSTVNKNTNPVADTVSNKDSGIYDDDFSPNVNIFKKGRINRTPLKSRHVGNLEELFKPPDNDIEPAENNVLTESQYNDDKPYQIYTVEALVEHATPNSSQLNGDISSNDKSETPDVISDSSLVHDLTANNEFKDMVSKNNESNPNLNETDANDALQFLDDVLDFSEKENLEKSETKAEIDIQNTVNDNVINVPKSNKDGILIKCDESYQEDTENNELDFLDDLNRELENETGNDGGVDSTLQSDAESEITVTEDDTLAMFDSILEGEIEIDDNKKDGNDSC